MARSHIDLTFVVNPSTKLAQAHILLRAFMRLLLNLPRDVYAMALQVERCPGGLGGGRRTDAGFSWHTEHQTFVGVVGVGYLDPQVVAVDVYPSDEH